MSLPRYSEYKDSGVEWLGEIPTHWTFSQSRRMFKVRSEPALADDQMLTASQKYGVLLQADFVLREGRRVVEVIQGKESLKHVEPDDFIISMRSFQGGIEWCRLRGSTSFHYVMLTPVKWVRPAFFAHLLKSTPYIQALRRTTDLIRDGQELRFSNFAQVPLPVVPSDEQEAIAAFLDRETAKIDVLIAEQEKLIALLAEKRQATISHAVTRGLNPDAPTKDSGVAWLGEVPAHWDAGCLKRFAEVIDCKHYTVEFLDDGLPIASIRELRDNRIDLTDAKRTSLREWEFLREGRVPMPGDLVFCRNASVGAVGYVSETTPSFCMGQDVCLIRPMTKSKFMHYQLIASGTTNQIEAFLVGATIRRANVEEIRNLVVAWPPESEQALIAAFLDAETKKLDTLRSEAERAVQLLTERRSALIAAAVTGQIDVRGGVAASA
jgi:type I restriction enzyme, S subunit